MIDHSTSPRPAIDSTAPAMSGRSAAGFLESGTSGTAHSSPAAAMGTLIRNTDPHQKWASSTPPTGAEQLLVISPELADVLSAIISRIRGTSHAVLLVAAYDDHERLWLPPAPVLFQRRTGAENRDREGQSHAWHALFRVLAVTAAGTLTGSDA